MKVVVAGASGFVGSRLCSVLHAAGHEVAAMTRRPDGYTGAGRPVLGDVHEPDGLAEALAGCEVAYYLVHSLDRADFAGRDASGASAFGAAAAAAGAQRIVYLGGLGDDTDQLSAHLRSRREVETLLGAAGVPVTTLRAGIIVGCGGISWELTRQLVEHLPIMVTPKWVRTRTQPIAIDDVVRYLVAVLDLPQTAGRVFEIGGPEVLRYITMLRRVAAIEGRPLLVLPVPLLTPRLSSLWLSLVTDIDTATGRALVDSMTNEVVVHDHNLRRLVPFEPTSYDEAVRCALRETRTSDERWTSERRGRTAIAAACLAGAALLRVALSAKPGSARFYGASLATAAIWTVGAVASGSPIPAGRPGGGGGLKPVATGVAAFTGFYAAALGARRIPLLETAISSVLRHADVGSAGLVVTSCANAVGEELFFRGALYAAGEKHPIVASSLAYTAVTAATGNVALTFAGVTMGPLFAQQRRASGGVHMPTLTHVTWSLLMVRLLPRLLRGAARREPELAGA